MQVYILMLTDANSLLSLAKYAVVEACEKTQQEN